MSESPRVVSTADEAVSPPAAETRSAADPPAGVQVQAPPDEAPPTSAPADEVVATLHRIERMLQELRGGLETNARAQHFRHFSLARLSGALLQSLVVLLIIFALADWVYAAPPAQQLVKLAFAGVMQVGALTAFVMARDD